MNYQLLSKEVSYALRHAPWEYELEMDEEGWVPINQLLDALHREEKWKAVKEEDLVKMIEESEKKRHELCEGRIKAYYGHSIPMKISKEVKRPPDVLYHGTARRFLTSIKEGGILPQSRQYVHLSQDMETAVNVGKRHDERPCILIIDAKKAWEDGIKFYLGNEKVWLADQIPNNYIYMFRVLGKLPVRNLYSVSVEGNTELLKNDVKLMDEKGNIFSIQSVGMTHYKSVEDAQTNANILLNGDVENIGFVLSIV